MQTSSFTTHHSPHEVTMSLGVENSVGIKTWALEKNTKWESASSSADFRACPGLLGLEARLLCPEYGWVGRQSQITPRGPGNRTHRLQSSEDSWGLGRRRTSSHWPLVMSCPCLQGPGNAPWLMECLIFCEYTFPLGGAATGRGSRPPEGPVGECQSARHRGPSVVLK